MLCAWSVQRPNRKRYRDTAFTKHGLHFLANNRVIAYVILVLLSLRQHILIKVYSPPSCLECQTVLAPPSPPVAFDVLLEVMGHHCLLFGFLIFSLAYQTCKRMYDDYKSTPNNVGKSNGGDVLTTPSRFLTTMPTAESSLHLDQGSMSPSNCTETCCPARVSSCEILGVPHSLKEKKLLSEPMPQ